MGKPTTFSNVLTFRPTLEEFKNFSKYVAYIETILNQNKELGALVKVIRPREVVVRTSGYSDESIGSVSIPEETVQTISESNGYYTLDSRYRIPKKIKSVGAFLNSQTSENPLTTELRERLFWSDLTNPDRQGIYYQNIDGSLMDKCQKYGNLNHLGTILDYHSGVIPGVTTPMMYFGIDGSLFPLHVEDDGLHSISYIHWTTMSGCKIWYGISPEYRNQFEDFLKMNFKEDYKNCSVFWKHKMHLVDPLKIIASGIPLQRVEQRSDEYIITFPGGYHFGFTIDKTIAEACNFGLVSSVEYYKNEISCGCRRHKLKVPIQLDFDNLVKLFLMSNKNWNTKCLQFLPPVSLQHQDKAEDETKNTTSCNMEVRLDTDTGDMYYRYKYQGLGDELGQWTKMVCEVTSPTLRNEAMGVTVVSQIESSVTKEPTNAKPGSLSEEFAQRSTYYVHKSVYEETSTGTITYPNEKIGTTCDVIKNEPIMHNTAKPDLAMSLPLNGIEIEEIFDDDPNEIENTETHLRKSVDIAVKANESTTPISKCLNVEAPSPNCAHKRKPMVYSSSKSELKIQIPVNEMEIDETIPDLLNEIEVTSEEEAVGLFVDEEYIWTNSLETTKKANKNSRPILNIINNCVINEGSPDVPFSAITWLDEANELAQSYVEIEGNSVLDEMDALGTDFIESERSTSQTEPISKDRLSSLSSRMDEEGLEIIGDYIHNVFAGSSSAMEMDDDALKKTVNFDRMIENLKSQLPNRESANFENIILEVLESSRNCAEPNSSYPIKKTKNVVSNVKHDKQQQKRNPIGTKSRKDESQVQIYPDKQSFVAENKSRSEGNFENDTCYICSYPLPKKYKSRRGFLNHMAMHVLNIGITCDICGKKFPYVSPFKRHHKKHTEVDTH